MSNIIDVNQSDFQTQVIQRSHQQPVVVDFWAPWCGPCRMLGPILERLAQEGNGRFLLAKVNADHNPQLSMQYDVRGIPAVKAFHNGRVVDEFVGAQPEPRVRQFIQRLPDSGRPQQQIKTAPGRERKASLQQARKLLRQGQGCQAQRELERITAGSQQAEARRLLPLARFLCQATSGWQDVGPEDLNTAYRQAASAVQRREHATALYNLLAVLRQDGRYRNGEARAVAQALFELLGADDPLTKAYQPLIP